MEIGLVLIILAGAVYLFVTEKFTIDLVAIMVLGALLLVELLATTGGWVDQNKWLTPEDAISGFSNPATITVGAMFVLSAGLQRTGAVGVVARLLFQWGRWEWLMMLLVILTLGSVSMFINNTAAVAVFLPVVMAVAARRKFAASRLLIPLSFSSEFGGVCTLIGSSTNLLVSYIAAREGYGAFGMFEMMPLGLILFGAGTLYFLVLGRWLLPRRESQQLIERYQLGEYITEMRVMGGSGLIGKTVVQSKLGAQHDVTVLEILRQKEKLWSPLHEPIQAGDLLLVRGKVAELMQLKDAAKLEMEAEFKLRDESLKSEEMTIVEVLVAPQSSLIGRSLVSADFRRRFRAVVLAIQRRSHTFHEKLKNVRLEFGDALLVLAPHAEAAKLRGDESFVVLSEVEEPSLRRGKAPIALGVIAVVVSLATLKIMPIMVSAVLGCVALVVTRCITLDEAYDAIDWKVIFLLAGILPLGIAMEKSGAAMWITEHSLQLVGGWGPVAALAAIYLLTAALTEAMSNNASAILLAPIAISTAVGMGVNPKPFLLAVMFAASTSFATPVGYQTNAMIHTPGGYKFTDFMKVGIPLIGLFFALSVYFIPQFWPF